MLLPVGPTSADSLLSSSLKRTGRGQGRDQTRVRLPGAAGARLYPSVFEVGKTVVDVDPGFTELAPTLRGALTNLGRAQAMVDRAAEVWRESVNLTRVAEDISGAMITALLRADAATSAEQGSFLNQQ